MAAASRRRAGPAARESGTSREGPAGGAEAGTSEWPTNPPTAGSRGRAGIPPALRFGAPKLAALELALISRAYVPRPRPPSAAMRDYAPSHGDRLRLATRCA